MKIESLFLAHIHSRISLAIIFVVALGSLSKYCSIGISGQILKECGLAVSATSKMSSVAPHGTEEIDQFSQ